MKTEEVLFIAIPAHRGFESPCVLSLIAAKEVLERAGVRVCLFVQPGCSFVGWARDLAAHQFLKCDGETPPWPKANRLLFVDSDISFPPDLPLRMLSAQKPLLAVACPKKEINYKNLAAGFRGNLNLSPELIGADVVMVADKKKEEPLTLEDGLLRVKSAGTGLMMIERAVFEAIEKAGADRYAPDGYYYRSGANTQTLGENLFAFFHFRIRWDAEDQCNHYDSEDYAFCLRWRALGGEIHVLADADVGHTGSHTFQGNLHKTLAIGGQLPMPHGQSPRKK
jgi:hypothetical protein